MDPGPPSSSNPMLPEPSAPGRKRMRERLAPTGRGAVGAAARASAVEVDRAGCSFNPDPEYHQVRSWGVGGVSNLAIRKPR